MSDSPLTELDSHFSFGQNWYSFARIADQPRLDEAIERMGELIPPDRLRGKRLLDIGCGSGLHLLAAQRLGAAEVVGIDLDPDSVRATSLLFERLGEAAPEVHALSVFDLPATLPGPFDVVYSWGVLHHTGDLWRAVERAAAMVAPGGVLAIAIYQKTPSCPFWQREKRWYSTASPWQQALARGLYKGLWFAAHLVTGSNPWREVRDYARRRGMEWSHDLHDWLGGYPYQSATASELTTALESAGFTLSRSHVRQRGLALLGSGCDEFLFQRLPADGLTGNRAR